METAVFFLFLLAVTSEIAGPALNMASSWCGLRNLGDSEVEANTFEARVTTVLFVVAQVPPRAYTECNDDDVDG